MSPGDRPPVTIAMPSETIAAPSPDYSPGLI